LVELAITINVLAGYAKEHSGLLRVGEGRSFIPEIVGVLGPKFELPLVFRQHL